MNNDGKGQLNGMEFRKDNVLNGLTVDGAAISASMRAQSHSIAQVPEPNVTYDLNELKRKLERKEIEIKRKDKEIIGYQKEIARGHKDVKLANAELQSFRDRNEQLQQSLINSRMLSQTARDEADSKLTSGKIRELEQQVNSYTHRVNQLESDIAKRDADKIIYEEKIIEIVKESEAIKESELKILAELEDTSIKLKFKEQMLIERNKDLKSSMSELTLLNGKIQDLEANFDKKQIEIRNYEEIIAEIREDNRKLRSTLIVRSETNSILRNQIEEISETSYILSKEEMLKYKKYEDEAKSLSTRVKDLVKSVELHMDLLHRAEAENIELKKVNAETKDTMVRMQCDLNDATVQQTANTRQLKAARKELLTLRRETKTQQSELETLRDNPNGDEFRAMKQTMINMTRGKQEEIEGKKDEKRRRQLAEDATRALRSRISFLLEQLDQASKLSIDWQEQKGVLVAEISAIHSVNQDLRQRLANLQLNYIDKHLDDAISRRGGGRSNTFMTATDGSPMKSPSHNPHIAPPIGPHEPNLSEIEEIVSGRNGKTLGILGGPLANPAANTMPISSESVVERALFDTICAFSSGTRSKSKKNKKRKQISKNVYKVQELDDGSITIVVDKQGDTDVDATELLLQMQIPAFLKFCSTKPDSRNTVLFTEKIASVLNFCRNSMLDLLEQLGESRIEAAKILSRTVVSTERFDKIKARFTKERISKQKSIMKYVQEQMRQSDMRQGISVISSRAEDHLEEMRSQNYNSSSGRVIGTAVEIMSSLVKLSTELSKITDDDGNKNSAVSAPGGSMEIRMPDSQLDDETLHGAIGLICGILVNPNRKNDTNTIESNQHGGMDINTSTTVLSNAILSSDSNYLNRITLLNLKGNHLTDLSCKVLSSLVEKSPELRILDLRDNCISDVGAKMLYDSTRKNTSILYVTQRQSGFMIEGHREIIGSGKSAIISEDERREDFERLVGGPKHPLRIDMRNNNPDQEILEEFLEAIEVKKNKSVSSNQDDNIHTGMSPRVNTRTKTISRSPSRKVVRSRSASPSATRLRPLSASSRGRGNESGEYSDNERNRTNSAKGMMKINRGRKHSDSDQDSNSDEEDLNPNVIDHIEKRKNKGVRTDKIDSSDDRKKSGGIVGSMIDDQIRQMQENGVGTTLKKGIAENSPSRQRSPMKSSIAVSSPNRKRDSDNDSDSYHHTKMSVKERTLTETKSVYSAKLHWPGLDDETDIISTVKRPKSASATGRSSGRTVTITNSSINSSSTNKTSKRPQSASSVREKLNVAKEKDSSLKGGGNKKKLNSTNSSALLESLQKFNPSLLF